MINYIICIKSFIFYTILNTHFIILYYNSATLLLLTTFTKITHYSMFIPCHNEGYIKFKFIYFSYEGNSCSLFWLSRHSNYPLFIVFFWIYVSWRKFDFSIFATFWPHFFMCQISGFSRKLFGLLFFDLLNQGVYRFA